MELIIKCPACSQRIDIPNYISVQEFEGQLRCWNGCHLLWNVVIRDETLVSIDLEENLIPAMENAGGRFN